LSLILDNKVNNEAWRDFRKLYASQLKKKMAERTTDEALEADV